MCGCESNLFACMCVSERERERSNNKHWHLCLEKYQELYKFRRWLEAKVMLCLNVYEVALFNVISPTELRIYCHNSKLKPILHHSWQINEYILFFYSVNLLRCLKQNKKNIHSHLEVSINSVIKCGSNLIKKWLNIFKYDLWLSWDKHVILLLQLIGMH